MTPASEMVASSVRTASRSLAEGKWDWVLVSALLVVSLRRGSVRGGDERTILTLETMVSTALCIGDQPEGVREGK